MNYYKRILTTFLPGETAVSTVMGAMLGGYLGVELTGIDASTQEGQVLALTIPSMMACYVILVFVYHWLGLTIAARGGWGILTAFARAISLTSCFFFVLSVHNSTMLLPLITISIIWLFNYIFLGILGFLLNEESQDS